MNPAVEYMLQFFDLGVDGPDVDTVVDRVFHELAHEIASGPNNRETTVALRKLLGSREAAKRAVRVG